MLSRQLWVFELFVYFVVVVGSHDKIVATLHSGVQRSQYRTLADGMDITKICNDPIYFCFFVFFFGNHSIEATCWSHGTVRMADSVYFTRTSAKFVGSLSQPNTHNYTHSLCWHVASCCSPLSLPLSAALSTQLVSLNIVIRTNARQEHGWIS